jgi:hypothetical protein
MIAVRGGPGSYGARAAYASSSPARSSVDSVSDQPPAQMRGHFASDSPLVQPSQTPSHGCRCSATGVERATAVACLLAMAIQVGPVPVRGGQLIALALLPVLWPLAKRHKAFRTLTISVVAAAFSGFLLIGLAELTEYRDLSAHGIVRAYCALIGFWLLAALLCWTSVLLGRYLAFSLLAGALVISPITTPSLFAENPWKYGLAWPIATLTVLASDRWGHRPAVAVNLLVIAVVSALFGFRSFLAVSFLALALLPLKGHFTTRGRGMKVMRAALLLAVAVSGIYFGGVRAAESGVLGQAVAEKQRTQDQTGPVILVARPEIAVSLSLLSERPWGWGPGIVPTSADVEAARRGMARFSTLSAAEPVVARELQDGVRLHSMLSDLWFAFGLAGAVTLICIAIAVIRGTALTVSQGGAFSYSLILLGPLACWDMLFSPFQENYTYVAATFTLAFLSLDALAPTVARQNADSTRHTPKRGVSRAGLPCEGLSHERKLLPECGTEGCRCY